jgi:glycosyltransferase involved in cell wall biosynthesis
MRLLVLTSSFPTRENPGGGIFIRRLLEQLPGKIQVTIVTPDTATKKETRDSRSDWRVKWVRYAPKSLQILANHPGGMPAALKAHPWLVLILPLWALAMFAVVLRLAAGHDLIHAHWSVCGLIGGVAGRMSGTPVLTTLHGTDVAWVGRYAIFRLVLKLCIALNPRIVAVSPAMARRLHSRWPRWRSRIQTIPNGIAREFFSVATNREWDTTREFRFTVIGNLIPSKQVHHILEAFKRLADEGRTIRLVIAGDGPCRSELMHSVQCSGISPKVEFMGAIPPDRVPAVLSQSHALVLASGHEGRSTIVMEAMATGAAVIATNIDGVRELIEHGRTGLLFAPGDIEALTGHMASLLDQPGRAAALAQRAHHWATSQGLTWAETAARYDRLYRQMLGRGD